MATFTDCGASAGMLHVTSTAMRPDPPVSGKELRFILGGDLTKLPGDGTTGRLVLKFGLIALVNETFTWTELLDGQPTPKGPGPVELVFPTTLDIQPPRGTWKGTITVSAKDGTELACQQVEFVVG
ncbi:hypothetical protein ABH920_008533 [Catenulispora sp. EB89]|uniref:hypothetical protein n=1 Tax=Catenulispora sp. EB89 TaxID=3156257 RepID=UPI0035165F22